MTVVLDRNGVPITVGARVVEDICGVCGGSGDPPDDLSGIGICAACGGTGHADATPVGTVTELTDPDGDVNEYGRPVALGPYVIVDYDDGTRERWTATWNATGPWDDYRDDYTCDDVEVAS